MNPEQLLGNVVALVVLGMILLVTLAVMAFVCHLISDAQKSLPFEHQKIQPGLVWLMMIPCVNIVMNFFVFIQVPASFDSFFRSRGEMPDTSLGTLGIIYAILATLSPIPYLGGCFGIVALVLLIIFLVKLNDAKKRVLAIVASGGAPAVPFGY